MKCGDKLKHLPETLFASRAVRYLISGGLTTAVNLVTFFVLRTVFRVPLNPANIVSVLTAILFAYWINAGFVFHSERNSVWERFKEFVRFVGAWTFTMVVEVGGVWLMAGLIGNDDMIAKVLIQFIVLVLNYVISRVLVFIEK